MIWYNTVFCDVAPTTLHLLHSAVSSCTDSQFVSSIISTFTHHVILFLLIHRYLPHCTDAALILIHMPMTWHVSLTQMNDAIEEPTAFSRTYARTVAFFQFIVIGPIAIATTIVHLLTCCCCLPLWIISVPSEVPRSIKHRVVNILSNWLTCWCTIWTSFISMMAYLVFLSLCFVPYLIYFIIRWSEIMELF